MTFICHIFFNLHGIYPSEALKSTCAVHPLMYLRDDVTWVCCGYLDKVLRVEVTHAMIYIF